MEPYDRLTVEFLAQGFYFPDGYFDKNMEAVYTGGGGFITQA